MTEIFQNICFVSIAIRKNIVSFQQITKMLFFVSVHVAPKSNMSIQEAVKNFGWKNFWFDQQTYRISLMQPPVKKVWACLDYVKWCKTNVTNSPITALPGNSKSWLYGQTHGTTKLPFKTYISFGLTKTLVFELHLLTDITLSRKTSKLKKKKYFRNLKLVQ